MYSQKIKLVILTSHPIQYQAPLFQLLAKQPEIDLTVYFCWDFGVQEPTYDTEFGKKIKWDIPLLEGYNYKFLKNYSLKPSSNFWGRINPNIIKELINYNTLLVFGWNSFTNWLAFITAFIFKIPVLLQGEAPFNQELLKPKWKIRIKKIILGWLFRRISAFLYIGEENKKFYQYYGVPDKKLFSCPYAVDNERFIKQAKSEKREANRKELGIKDRDVVILFVGKLIEKKRPMDLLKAYQLITHNSQLKTQIALLFVGDGTLRPELEKYVKEHNLKNVHFVGFKNQTKLPQYYALADIFVLPSGIGETWGLVVNEAMCFGLPIIVSNVVGCGLDLVKNNENGFIFPLGNIEKLTAYLKDLVIDEEKRKKFGEKSFEIIQNYIHERDIEGILKALKQ